MKNFVKVKNRSFRLLLLFLSILLLNTHALSQSDYALEWQRCYGGSRSEVSGDLAFPRLIATKDGGYAFVGHTTSYDGDVDKALRHQDVFLVDSFKNDDIWLVKLSSMGHIQWQQCFSGTGTETVRDIKQTSDGGYVLCGWTSSRDGDFLLSGGTKVVGDVTNGFVMKVDSVGRNEWVTHVGGTKEEILNQVVELSDGSFVAVGLTTSNEEIWNGFPWMNHGYSDGLIVWLNSNGTNKRNKLLGGMYSEVFYAICATKSNTFMVAGSAESPDGDVSHFKGGFGSDAWLVEIDTLGNILWDTCYGGNDTDQFYELYPTTGGNYLVCGVTISSDGDVVGYHVPQGIDNFYTDAWILHLDSGGSILYQSCIGGTSWDYMRLTPASTGKFAFIGYTRSTDGDLADARSLTSIADIWVGELSGEGKLIWQKCLGGQNEDYGSGIVETPDGYIINGLTRSNDGDVSGNHWSRYGETYDIWVAKLSNINSVASGLSSDTHWAHPYPNPSWSQEINLRIHPTARVRNVELVNPLGITFSVPYRIVGNLFTADIHNLSAGTYTIHITYESTRFEERRKFIKE